jgi:glucose/arabinose dehydrogenase
VTPFSHIPARRSIVLIALVVVAALSLPGCALAAPPGYTVTPVHTGLAFPVAFTFTPDGRLLYLERNGRVMVFDNDADPTPGVWATIPTHASVDRGLLGITLHPSYPDSPYVYLFHSNPSPLVDRIVRLRDLGATGVDYTVIRDGIPSTSDIHHGGRIAFAPDGNLWLTYGDQNDQAAAQDPANIRGKLLRFTSMGLDAPGNAFGPAHVRGVRNAFGICFDHVTGSGYFTDNGPECDDELNLIVGGANYGWGPADPCGGQPAGTLLALASFTPPFAPTSCVVCHGTELDGNLFFGGYVDGSLRRVYFRPGSGGTVVDSVVTFHEQANGHVLDVTQSRDGKLWFSTLDTIYRIDGPAPAAAPAASERARRFAAAPNPFLESVTFEVAGSGAVTSVTILDPSGRRVRRWMTSATRATWDGKDEAGREAPPGLYLVRVGDHHSPAGRVLKLAR